MQQWLVAGAVGSAYSFGVGDRLADGGRDLVGLSTVSEPWVALQSSPSGDVGGMFMAAVVLLVLGLGGVAAWHSGIPSLLSGSRSSGGGSNTAEPDSPETATEPDAGTAEAGTDAADAAGETEPPQQTDQDLIVDILESNDGRMKQAKIVDRTGWSKSKVSMLLSEMEDDGDISKLRVGRENIISLSGNEPEAAGSPFDDE